MTDLERWRELGQQLRVDSIRSSAAANSGHPTSSMSAADLMAVLLDKYLRYDFDNPDTPTNDHLVFSKGHASPLVYSLFKAAGAISDEDGRPVAFGDCFNVRVAGNIANDDILGSMEFACKVAGAKLVLVMGHTACGAIKGAIDKVQLGKLTGLLAKIRPAVEATRYQGERSAKNYDFVDAVARKNVELAMADIRRRSALLADLQASGAIKIVGAMYNLETGVIEFLG